jgi:hypothetical protein
MKILYRYDSMHNSWQFHFSLNLFVLLAIGMCSGARARVRDRQARQLPGLPTYKGC